MPARASSRCNSLLSVFAETCDLFDADAKDDGRRRGGVCGEAGFDRRQLRKGGEQTVHGPRAFSPVAHFLISTVGEDAAPMTMIRDLVHLQTDVRVGAHGSDLAPGQRV